MYSVWVRANTVLFVGLTALAVLALFNVLSVDFFSLYNGELPLVKKLRVNEARVLSKFRDGHRAVLRLDLDVDISPIWNWNVKQVFVYATAEYPNQMNDDNTVVIFDRIVRTVKNSRVSGRNLVKYPLYDERSDLRGQNVQIKLAYEVHPLVGPLYSLSQRVQLYTDKNHFINYTLPTIYS